MWAHFWEFYPVSLTYKSVFVPVPGSFGRNISNFPHSIFWICIYHIVLNVPSVPRLLRLLKVFIMHICILSNTSYVSTEMIIIFACFCYDISRLLVYVEVSLHTRGKPHLAWVNDLYFCWIWLANILRIFCMCLLDISVYFFAVSWFGDSVVLVSWKDFGRIPSLWIVSVHLWRNGISSGKVWKNSAVKPSGPGHALVGVAFVTYCPFEFSI